MWEGSRYCSACVAAISRNHFWSVVCKHEHTHGSAYKRRHTWVSPWVLGEWPPHLNMFHLWHPWRSRMAFGGKCWVRSQLHHHTLSSELCRTLNMAPDTALCRLLALHNLEPTMLRVILSQYERMLRVAETILIFVLEPKLARKCCG